MTYTPWLEIVRGSQTRTGHSSCMHLHRSIRKDDANLTCKLAITFLKNQKINQKKMTLTSITQIITLQQQRTKATK